MRKIIFLLVLLFPAYLSATSFHTIVINGVNSGWTANERFADISSADSAYVTWDDSYLYFGIKGANASDSMLHYLYIDTDPCGDEGDDSVFAFGNYIHLAFKADYVIIMRNANAVFSIEVREFNMNTREWDLYGYSNTNVLNTNEVNFSIGNDYRECRIKKSMLGNPNAFKINSLSELLLDQTRTMAFPSEGWADAINAPSQQINHFYTFQWTNGVSPNSAGGYDLLASPPVILSGPQDTTLCEGNALTFQVNVSGTLPLHYQWKKDGTPIGGANGNMYAITSVNSAQEGTYTCTVWNLCDTLTSNGAVLTVNTPPSNRFSNDWTLLCGTDTTIALSPEGTLPITYQWSKDGLEIPDDTNFFKHYFNIDSTSRGNYSCRLTNVCGNYDYHFHVFVNCPVCGNISSDTFWNTDTIKVNCDITVDDQRTLSVSRGTVVKFMGNYKINVAGRILALGTESMPVSFIVNDTAGFSNIANAGGGWHGIRFDNVSSGNDTSRFVYCNFRNGKATGTGNDRNGGVIFTKQFNKLTLSDCQFTTNRSIGDGGAVYSILSQIKVSNCIFRNNIAGGYAGAIYMKKSGGKVISNIISNNLSTNPVGFGGAFYSDTCTLLLVNNLVSKNSARYGAGIFMNMTTAVLNNNTISDNTGAVMGGGLFCVSSNPVLTNCILYDNAASSFGSQVYLDPNSDPDFYYCDIKGGTSAFGGPGAGTNYNGAYQNNIDQNPLFINNLNGDYRLSHNSSCINSGSISTSGLSLPMVDLAGVDRINGGRIDIGAYEYKLVMNVCGPVVMNTLWDADTVKVNCDITVSDNYTLTINPGTMVKFMGMYKILVSGRLIAAGTPSQMIHFFPADTTSGWRGIRIVNSASDTSRIVFSKFSYGNVIQMPPVPQYDDYGGLIFVQNSDRVLISACILEKGKAFSGGGLAVINSSAVIRNNVIKKNSIPGTGDGGGLYLNGSRSFIHGNLISNNFCVTGTGGGMMMLHSDDVLQNNIICNNNSPDAVYIDATGCSCSPRLINNTIANNSSRGLYINANDTLALYNNIITGGQNPAADIRSVVNFYNCNINAPASSLGAGIIENVIDLDPLFISPSAGNGNTFDGSIADWSLSGCSPCIDKGITDTSGLHLLPADFTGNHRVLNDTIDIGAFEIQRPYIAVQPDTTQNVCEGQNGSLSVRVNSTIPVNYQWEEFSGGNWQALPGGTNDTIIVQNVQAPMDSVLFRCLVIADCSDTLTSLSSHFNVLTPPSISLQPVNATICEGGDTAFTVAASGSNLTYQWQVSTNGGALWQNITGNPTALTSHYVLENVCASCMANSIFRCVVSGSCTPAAVSGIVSVTVNLIPRFTAQPADVTVCEGENANFSVTANGTNLTYQWQISRDGGVSWTDSTGAVNSGISIYNITANMNGFRYRCVIGNMCIASVSSFPATLTVNTSPVLTSQPQNADVCEGSDTSFTVRVSGTGIVYRWQLSTSGGSSWSNSGVTTSMYPINHAMLSQNNYRYRCIFSGTCPGGDTSNTVTLSVHTSPVVNIGPDFTMMKTDTVLLDASPGFSSYMWNNNPSLNNSTLEIIGMNVTGNNPHIYFVMVTNQYGCVDYDTVSVTIIDNTGISESAAGCFHIYPNPTDGMLILTLERGNDNISGIEITDMHGKVVFKDVFVNKNLDKKLLDLTFLEGGLYIFKVESNNAKYCRKLVIE